MGCYVLDSEVLGNLEGQCDQSPVKNRKKSWKGYNKKDLKTAKHPSLRKPEPKPRAAKGKR
jgi:hypothetical protein